uniref:Uncharacterized protein n=1 Tax=Branchiostoma floridae TaxID=7739 RepID=C3XRX1_BRAFL|eukprot:XP_002613430.1 hypothetical protein BRAFLDRAFT_84553 [Branchiostoma floridae]
MMVIARKDLIANRKEEAKFRKRPKRTTWRPTREKPAHLVELYRLLEATTDATEEKIVHAYKAKVKSYEETANTTKDIRLLNTARQKFAEAPEAVSTQAGGIPGAKSPDAPDTQSPDAPDAQSPAAHGTRAPRHPPGHNPRWR